MSDKLRVLLSPFGSEGDVNPLLWAAGALARHGHRPHLLLPPIYGALADRAGLPWTQVGEPGDFESLVRDPKFWDPLTGSAHVAGTMLSSFPAFLKAARSTGFEPDLVITSTLGLAAAFAAEAVGIPRLTVHMQPAVLRSLGDCPVFSHGLEWLPAAPNFVKRFVFGAVDWVLNFTMRKPVNSLRAELGLAPIQDVYRDLILSGDGMALLCPEWFAKPQPDWPTGVRQFGFPLNESRKPPTEDIRTWIANHGAPLLWTHGSANFDTQAFHHCAIEASRRLEIPFLIVGPQPPDHPLPSSGRAFSHLPFDAVFPLCRAVVHHGGIGTTAKAIAAGIPQLVIPRAHDQPDNAARVERMGLGLRISYHGLSSKKVADRLTHLLNSDSIARTCRRIAPLTRSTQDEPAFVSFVESLAANKGSKTNHPTWTRG